MRLMARCYARAGRFGQCVPGSGSRLSRWPSMAQRLPKRADPELDKPHVRRWPPRSDVLPTGMPSAVRAVSRRGSARLRLRRNRLGQRAFAFTSGGGRAHRYGAMNRRIAATRSRQTRRSSWPRGQPAARACHRMDVRLAPRCAWGRTHGRDQLGGRETHCAEYSSSPSLFISSSWVSR